MRRYSNKSIPKLKESQISNFEFLLGARKRELYVKQSVKKKGHYNTSKECKEHCGLGKINHELFLESIHSGIRALDSDLKP